MKKVVSLLLVSVLIFSLSFSCFASVDLSKSAFVDKTTTLSNGVSFDFTRYFDFFTSLLDNYLNSIQKKAEAARSYYFYQMLNDDISGGLPVLDSSGTKFSDDILNFYFERYYEALNGLDIYDSNGNIFLQAAGFNDTRFSLKLLSFADTRSVVSEGLTPNDLKPHALQSFKDYYNTLLARFLLSQGFDVTDPNPGKSGLDIAPGYVTSEELVEGIELDNSLYTAKDYKSIISYRTDKNYAHYETTYYVNQFSLRSFYTPVLMFSSCLFGGGANDVYLLPFYKGDKDYLSQYQLHFILETVTDDSGNTQVLPQIKMWDMISETEADAVDLIPASSQIDFSEIKYIRLFYEQYNSRFRIIGHKTLDKFLTSDDYTGDVSITVYNDCKLYSSDLTNTLFFNSCIIGNTHYAKGLPSEHDSDTSNSCSNKGHCDVGFFTSDKPITTTYQYIDSSKIGKGQIVTINGDTIYNYTITNPDTGDSNTINEYVTNNYTYITNNNGGEAGGSSSGSGVGGNVTVGGSIDVGGSVGVDINVSVPDININVNGNGSGAGGSGSSIANPDDFTSADNVDLNKYYDEAVEQSTGFQKFLKDFFGFLPAELLGLILFAVAMAIVCRVFGR